MTERPQDRPGTAHQETYGLQGRAAPIEAVTTTGAEDGCRVEGELDPLVTVILCVYNGGGFLRAAVESVLDQTYTHLELLLIDDGSTDGAVDALERTPLAEDSRLRVVRQENAGKPSAMNRALAMLDPSSAFYAIQDADDLSHPKRIERQVSYMRRNPDVAGVFCGFDMILGDQEHVAPRFRGRTPGACAEDIEAFRMPGHDPTALYRVSAVADLRYDPELRIGEGLDYILRVGERSPLAVCEGCLYSYRVELSSLTKQDPRRRDDFVRRVLLRAHERRTAGAGLGVSIPTPAVLAAPPLEEGGRLRRRDLDNNLAAQFIESVLDHRAAGQRRLAFRIGFRCVAIWPWSCHYWKALAYAVLPESWLQRRRPGRL